MTCRGFGVSCFACNAKFASHDSKLSLRLSSSRHITLAETLCTAAVEVMRNEYAE